jgi:hypothetical protein
MAMLMQALASIVKEVHSNVLNSDRRRCRSGTKRRLLSPLAPALPMQTMHTRFKTSRCSAREIKSGGAWLRTTSGPLDFHGLRLFLLHFCSVCVTLGLHLHVFLFSGCDYYSRLKIVQDVDESNDEYVRDETGRLCVSVCGWEGGEVEGG